MAKKYTLLHALKLTIAGNTPVGAIDLHTCQTKITCQATNDEGVCIEKKVAFRRSTVKALTKDEQEHLIIALKAAMLEYTKFTGIEHKFGQIIVDVPMTIGGPGDMVMWIELPEKKPTRKGRTDGKPRHSF